MHGLISPQLAGSDKVQSWEPQCKDDFVFSQTDLIEVFYTCILILWTNSKIDSYIFSFVYIWFHTGKEQVSLVKVLVITQLSILERIPFWTDFLVFMLLTPLQL